MTITGIKSRTTNQGNNFRRYLFHIIRLAVLTTLNLAPKCISSKYSLAGFPISNDHSRSLKLTKLRINTVEENLGLISKTAILSFDFLNWIFMEPVRSYSSAILTHIFLIAGSLTTSAQLVKPPDKYLWKTIHTVAKLKFR